MGDKKPRKRSRFTVRLFPEEVIILTMNSIEYGTNMTEYIHDMIIHGAMLESQNSILTDKKFRRLLWETNHICNNLNQIVYISCLKQSVGSDILREQKENFEVLLGLYEDTFLYPDT